MSAEARVGELVEFALEELPSMRLPDGMYCLEVHADRRPRGRSVRYSIMVALGLLRARAAGYTVNDDLDELVDLVLAQSDDPALTAGDLGLLLWLDRRADRSTATKLLTALERRLTAAGALGEMEGMDVAWIAIGASECVRTGVGGAAEGLLQSARTQLCVHNRSRSGLRTHRAVGWRRRFPNFATQIYGTLALALLGLEGDQEALASARSIGDVILDLQRPDGGWPWIFDTQAGRVVEPYEVYSVHQDAMAPMGLLTLYEATGDQRYRNAAVQGIEWIFGRNDLQRSLLDSERRILYRSIRRRSPWNSAMLYASVMTAYAGLPVGAKRDWFLEINPTDRPYHLGWILEAWCGREKLAAPAS